MSQERNHGIDLLRGVSMFMIMLLHLVNRGDVISNTSVMSGQYCAAWLISVICFCAVNCFAAISGYVGVDSEFNWKRLISLWFTIAFYSIGITLAYSILQPETVSTKQLISAFVPIVTNQYWYMTAYFGMFLFIPIMNSALKNLPRESMFNLLIAIILFMCFIPNMTHCTKSSLGLMNGYSTIWLSIMYVVGGIVKRLNLSQTIKKSSMMLMFSLSCVFVFASKVIIDSISLKITGETHGGSTFLDYTSPFILLNAILLLCTFSRIRIESPFMTKFIRCISSAALGIYLIHVHPLIWDNILNGSTIGLAALSPISMIARLLLTALLAYISCLIIDYLRQILFRLLSISTLCNNIDILWIRLLSKCRSLITSEFRQ